MGRFVKNDFWARIKEPVFKAGREEDGAVAVGTEDDVVEHAAEVFRDGLGRFSAVRRLKASGELAAAKRRLLIALTFFSAAIQHGRVFLRRVVAGGVEDEGVGFDDVGDVAQEEGVAGSAVSASARACGEGLVERRVGHPAFDRSWGELALNLVAANGGELDWLQQRDAGYDPAHFRLPADGVEDVPGS